MGKYAIADEITRKTCATCEQNKPLSAFYATRPGGAIPRRNCIPCHGGHVRKADADRRAIRPETTAEQEARCRAWTWRSYGATHDEVTTLERLYHEGTQCDICAVAIVGKQMRADHDHVALRVRGVLCHTCNVGLGYFGDSIEGLQRGIAYLTRQV